MPVVLQITFRKPDDPGAASVVQEEKEKEEKEERGEEEQAAMMTRAQTIAHNVPGLLWKIWIAQPDNQVYGGTYLFENRQAAQAYLESPIPDDIRHQPDFTWHIFEINQELSAITHAPLQRPSSG